MEHGTATPSLLKGTRKFVIVIVENDKHIYCGHNRPTTDTNDRIKTEDRAYKQVHASITSTNTAAENIIHHHKIMFLTSTRTFLNAAKAIQMQLTLKGFIALVFEPTGDDFLGKFLRIMDLESIVIGRKPRDNLGLFWRAFHGFQHFV